VAGSIAAFHKARSLVRRSRRLAACAVVALGLIAALLAVSHMPDPQLQAYTYTTTPDPPNQPIGQAKGIHPGRVVWVHDPDATDWNGSTGYWSDPGNTDQAVVDEMVSKAIRWLVDERDDAAAWDKLFRHFNRTRGAGDVGYQPGEKITIKANLTVCNCDSSGWVAPNGDQAENLQYVSMSRELALALLRQLVYVAGVAASDISIGDPTCHFANQYYNFLSAEFPTVRYLTAQDPGDRVKLPGRVDVRFSTTVFKFSGPGAAEARTDYVPVSYAEADYVINFAILKAHLAAVTLCAKNHYGSLIRRPPSTGGYYDLHQSLPYQQPNRGAYRALVDLMGHEHTGGKTLLYIIDGLWGGYSWGGVCPPQKWRAAPFNGDWPSSVLVSQDPVAIDSVGFDLWWAEDLASWNHYPFSGSGLEHLPHLAGGDDYLHEAALANDPPSGTVYDPEDDGTRLASLGAHEHWNNATDRKYSRNLGTGLGIELITSGPSPVKGRHVFYNRSRYDGNNPSANADDDGAIAPDKLALLPGAKATFLNYTSYSRGINGIMVDIASLPGTPTAADFAFKVGNNDHPPSWADAPRPVSVSVRPSAGVNGSDRITIIWQDNAIRRKWLQVTIQANAVTGLGDPEVFYFGNAVGETGHNPNDALVTPTDEVGVRNNPHTLGRNPAAIDNVYDFNRDGKVGPTDAIIARNNGTSFGAGTALILITGR